MSLKIVGLEAENFKRLRAVSVTPTGNIIEIAGNNGEGKSSLLDAIWVALKGRAAAPPEPIRQGEEVAYIELDLGKYKITRRFTRKDDGDYTDFLRVEDPDGLQYPKPQATLDGLLGAIGFDPFAFVNMKPADQAKALLQLVPLEVDLAELAALDKRIYDTRRDTNRDLKQAKARLDALPTGEKLPVADIDALRAQLNTAAEHNGQITEKKAHRAGYLERMTADRNRLQEDRDRIAALVKLADELEADLAARQKQVDEAKPLPEPIDTAAVSAELSKAERAKEANRELEMRDIVAAEVTELTAKSEGFTKRLEENEASRQAALAKATMPIEGLGVIVDEEGARVTYNQVPFEQISKADQIRASTAIAMAANPELRVLRISDGALLDDHSMSILQELSTAHDFQLWIELVKPSESTGIILEDGAIVGQNLEPKDRGKPKAPKPTPKQAALQDAAVNGIGATVDMVDTATGEITEQHVPSDQLFNKPPQQAKTMSQEEWDALTPARRAYFTKQGYTVEGGDE